MYPVLTGGIHIQLIGNRKTVKDYKVSYLSKTLGIQSEFSNSKLQTCLFSAYFCFPYILQIDKFNEEMSKVRVMLKLLIASRYHYKLKLGSNIYSIVVSK